jgi:hypothetical protein
MLNSAPQVSFRLGPARITLTPVDPLLWQELSSLHPGPAGLCLSLLPLALVRWHHVQDPAGPSTSPPGPDQLARMPSAALGPLLDHLCAPWVNPEEEALLEELEQHLHAASDYPGLDCSSCRDQESRGEGRPDCGACPRRPAPARARPALALYRILAGLPAAGNFLALPMTKNLDPQGARFLAMQLALIQRFAAERSRPES